jgi:hypothetical protein
MWQSQGSRVLPPQETPSVFPPPEGSNLFSTQYSDTSAKLQGLSPVLDDGTLLAELDNVTTTTDANVYLVKYYTRDKAGVDAATLANNWGIGVEAAKRTRLVTTQRVLKNGTRPMTGSYDTVACQSQCLLTSCTQQLSQGKITKQLRYFVLTLVL